MARQRRPRQPPKVKKIGDWKKARAVLPGFDAFYREAEIESIKAEAEFARRKILQAFKTSGASNGKKWVPNSDFTRRDKGSSKPLVNKGDLMGSVTIMEPGVGEYFVGIPNNVKAKDGTRMVSIAKVHEFGAVIVMQITKKQHRFFMAKLAKMGVNGGKGSGSGGFRPGATLVIKIPQRSFLGATKEAHFDGGKSPRRIKNRIAKKMREKVGLLTHQV